MSEKDNEFEEKELDSEDENDEIENSDEDEENNLIKACDDIVANGGRAPLIKCVIYGVGNIAYQNDKAIYILPITALED